MTKEYKDKELTCLKCNEKFVWTAGEQKFYDEKGLENEPKTCPTCRKDRNKDKTSEVTCDLCQAKGHLRLGEIDNKDPGNISVICQKCMDKELEQK